MSQLVYKDFDGSPRSIRLIVLEPGRTHESIRCTFLYRTLSNVQSYYALSYAWGDASDKCEILVGEQPLAVTRNLHLALIQLRESYPPQSIFWIDAICINQRNVPERNQQLLLMRDIYRLAKIVIIWTGVAENDSDKAIELVAQLSKDYKEHCRADSTRESHVPQQIIGSESEDLPSPRSLLHWHALGIFLNRSWFQRLWTFQEVTVASTALVMCGERILNWEVFEDYSMLLHLYIKQGYSSTALSSYPYVALRILFFARKFAIANELDETSLTSMVRGCIYKQVTDPRDRVYALVGLLGVSSIEIDYEKSVREVYIDMAKWSVTTDKNLRILDTIQFPKNVIDLPSWVRDWTSIPSCSSLVGLRFSAAGDSRPTVTFPTPDGSITLTGVQVDVIQSEGRVLEENNPVSPILHDHFCHWKALVSEQLQVPMKNGKSGPSSTEEEQSEIFWRILSADIIDDGEQHSRIPSGDRVNNVLGVWRGNSHTLPEDCEDNAFRTNQSKLWNAILDHCFHRKIFFTKKGYIGIAPAFAEIGDIVCVVFGSTVPFILRPSKERYAFVSSAYVHGIMDGEMMTALQNGQVCLESFLIL